MNSKKSTLISLGISLGLLAAGIWFLLNHFRFLPHSEYARFAIHHMYMHGGLAGFTIIFWLLTVCAVVLLISGALTKDNAPLNSGANRNSKAAAFITQDKA